MQLVEVLIFRAVNSFFTYQIPEKLTGIKIGTWVEVPLGKQQIQGIVVREFETQGYAGISVEKPVFEQSVPSVKIKFINKIINNRPIIPIELIKVINFLITEYLVNPYKAFQIVVGDKKLREISLNTKIVKIVEPNYPLTEEQKNAINTIVNSPKNKFLLFGVTASGKTEVYIQVIMKMLTENKTALLLVPEIALTPQNRRIFKQRFGDIVSVIHSGLTKKNKEIEWNKIYQGVAKIVIGPRSAIFSPLKNIGVIIIDEEHEPSYKQENHPRYFLHSIADFLAGIHQAKLILGSATPAIETYFQIKNNEKAEIINLKKRVFDTIMPQIKIIDLKQERFMGNKNILSQELENSIRTNLEKKEKTIILINRRGYAPYISCKKCGHVLVCPQCNLSFTFHKDQKFRCHRCNITIPITHFCPKCKTPSLAFSGLGIQKIELELQRIFENIKIYRLDRDAVKSQKELESVLTNFEVDGDILLGTQLVAKGHHFPNVTLVGILGIDTILNLPDYKAPERVFQLITQVAGRAGREHKPGLVIVETLQIEHPAIQLAASYNYSEFLKNEVEFRKTLNYPPFCNLINLLISSKQKTQALNYAKDLSGYLRKNFNLITKAEDLILFDVKPAPIEMINSFYRFQIIIKTSTKYLEQIKQILKNYNNRNNQVRFIIDFEPKSLL